MKQPELGKYIAGLRETKGLTQEELVSRCNISVRTLQRIESGLPMIVETFSDRGLILLKKGIIEYT